MRETRIENILKQEVEKLGGFCWKLTVLNLTGIPDRLILLPGGIARFVELKTKTGRPSKLQEYWCDKLQKLGFDSHIVYGADGVREYVRTLKDVV